MTHPEDSLPLDDFIEGKRTPDGIDLADMEAAARRLATEREAVTKKVYIVPGKKKTMLSQLDVKAGKLSMAIQVGTEFVRANPVTSKIYKQRCAELAAEETREAQAKIEAEALQKQKRERRKMRGKFVENELDPTD